MKELIKHLEDNKISFELKNNNEIIINNELFCLLESGPNGLLFDDDFNLIVSGSGEYDKYVYRFGGQWYWDSKQDIKSPKLNELRYIGKSASTIKNDSFLGVRGGYEILNGSRLYSDWCKKAKFLGITSLGICEKNTLAGVMKFQLECQKNNIKPIIGATYTVYRKKQDLYFDVKFYVKNEIGWHNLLMINKEVNVVNELKYIDEDKLIDFLDGLYIIIDPKSISYEDFYRSKYRELYDFYQLDTVEYEDEERDKWYLENLKKFYYSGIQPISITDSFYLEKEHNHIKNILNTIGGFREYKSSNQYFKDKEDYFNELDVLFNPNDESIFNVFQLAVFNENKIAEFCDFIIDTGNRHLPKYKMTDSESVKYKDNEDLFWSLIYKGLNSLVPKDQWDMYLDRVEEEYEVIKYGDVVDYFLTLHDIISWCKGRGILTGIGRGSAGGSVVSYLLGIIHIDPIKYDLLFSRFLNKGRIQVSLPDIDSDFPGQKRQEVKEYIENRFGHDYVCSVGTYTIFKAKSVIKDLSRLHGIPFQDINYITSIMEESGTNYSDIFVEASKNGKIKSFVKKYPEIVNDLRLIIGIPKARSIHACAMMIFPEEKTMYEWVPIRLDVKGVVSEWEGNELDSAGFLKEDILGIAQLDKFQDILNLIHSNTGENLNIYSIPVDDQTVYKYFQKGWNEDVFHFGSSGLTQYCKDLLPNDIEDLIAAISLYRPGAMENNFHKEYVLRKNGQRKVEYFVGSEQVLSKTYGVFVFQEQIMQLCQVLGGLTSVEADDVRKAMVKKKYEALHQYKQIFISNYCKNFGVDQEYSENVWDAIDKASTYLFNRSHAAAYTITGYISQWLKVHYPLEFWTVAFKYANEKDYPLYISEIQKIGTIRLVPVDINGSGESTYADKNKNTIYWSLSSVKQLGDIAVTQIMNDRNTNDQYFSFEEFLSRHTFKGSKVNKTVIENLITCGAFDDLENITNVSDRLKLINKFREINKVKVDIDKDIYSKYNLTCEDWWWSLMQKKLSGISFFDYHKLTDEFLESTNFFCSSDELQLDSYARYSSNVKIGGILTEYVERENKKGKWCRLVLESNYDFINITIWPEQFSLISELNLESQIGNIILLSGEIVSDKYLNKNIVQVNNNSEILILS